jgi:branched-chain amino acid transport system ATP-binding protein
MSLDDQPIVLEARGVCAGYGRVPVLRDLDLIVREGEIVALLGANGAGKTTTLLTLAGELRATSGEVRLRGQPIRSPLFKRARQGVGFIPEERAIISKLSTRDNLRLGRGAVEDAFSVFPALRPLSRRRAGLLSGGEQQMLALARVIAARPKVLLLDEVSLGLAPLAVKNILDTLRSVVSERGVSALIVEQHFRTALEYADRAYILKRGRIVMSGTGPELLGRADEIEATYLTNSVS